MCEDNKWDEQKQKRKKVPRDILVTSRMIFLDRSRAGTREKMLPARTAVLLRVRFKSDWKPYVIPGTCIYYIPGTRYWYVIHIIVGGKKVKYLLLVDGCVDAFCLDGRMDGYTHGQMGGCVGGSADGSINGCLLFGVRWAGLGALDRVFYVLNAFRPAEPPEVTNYLLYIRRV